MAAQQTPDLSGLVQEAISRSGWTTNSALAFVFEGTPSAGSGQVGHRVASAMEDPVGTAACLRVVWTLETNLLRVVEASSVGNTNEVVVNFDRMVSKATAEICGNYQLSAGIEVLSAALDGNGRVVRLGTTGMTTGRVYRLTVSGVTDLMTPPHGMPGGQDVVFPCLPRPVEFVKEDHETQGSWIGAYGSEGRLLQGHATNSCQPSYGQATAYGCGTVEWATSTTDMRALEWEDSTNRNLSAWKSSGTTNMYLDVNLTDGLQHQAALYCCDYECTNRSQKVEVGEPGTGRIWDTRILTTNTLSNGVWLVWNMTGRQFIRFTDLNPTKRAVASALCFDPPATLPGPDEDHDGVEDAWEILHYGNTNKTLAWYRTTDSDGDRMTDWEEYVAGTNPKETTSVQQIEELSVAGTNGVCLRWSSEAERVYDLWRSTNLVIGFDVRVATNLPATPPKNEYTDWAVPPSPFFYRIVVK
jgi:hypothetical protein